jgi:hypothetical protein
VHGQSPDGRNCERDTDDFDALMAQPVQKSAVTNALMSRYKVITGKP